MEDFFVVVEEYSDETIRVIQKYLFRNLIENCLLHSTVYFWTKNGFFLKEND